MPDAAVDPLFDPDVVEYPHDYLALLREKRDQLAPGIGVDAAETANRLGELEDRGCQRAGRVDPDHVVRSSPDEERPLECSCVEAGGPAEGADRRADADPLGEVDDQIRRPGVDLGVLLCLEHLAVGPFLDFAHGSSFG